MSKVTRSIRFDQELLDQAESLGVDISEVCREALTLAVRPKVKQVWGSKYKRNLAQAVRSALVSHIAATPEKETVVISVEPSGMLNFWIDGRYKVMVMDLIDEIKFAKEKEGGK